MKIKALKAAFPYTIPVLMGYIFMGIAFGILLKSKGYGFGWAFVMSTFIYAGSMQFVAINLLDTAGNLLTVAVITLMVNARHLFYGLAMLNKFGDMGKKKPYMIFSLSDETFSLHSSAVPPENIDKNWFHFFISFLNQSYWIIGSVIGGVLGSLITFNIKGIDFVMTALFVVIFVEQWRAAKIHTPAIIGIFASLVCLLCFGPKNFIVPSMIAILILLTLMRKNIEKRSFK